MDVINCFLFVSVDFLWSPGKWTLSTQKFVNQNSTDEGFPVIIQD